MVNKKETDSDFVAKEMRDKRKVILLNIALFSVLLVLIFDLSIIVYQVNNHIEKKEGGFVYQYYYEESKDLTKNSIIQAVSDKCEDSENPVRCVFDAIPMDYDYSRVGQPFPLFRTPSDYQTFGGVCRDYTLYRHSALKNLGINCLFDFSQERHVFLVCFYDEKFYELNNNAFIVRNG